MENLYKFSAGAKEDLLALHSEYKYSDIIAMVRGGQMQKDGTVKHNNVVVKVKGKQIIGVTLSHLQKFARFYTFNCVICFDSKKIQVGDPCNFCDGSGCDECEDGLTFKHIACPNCTGKQVHGERDEWNTRIKIERQQSHGNRWTLPRQTARAKRRKAG